jgi:hypothetical protein
MIAKSYISQSIRRINRLYLGPCSAQEALLFSKLATLELCGWIEVSMDDIALCMARRVLREQSHRTVFENDVVRPVYGFDYEKHFRRMLIGVIGLQGVARMERRVDRALFDPMCGALSTLKPYRDKHAHTYVKGTTLALDAPSVTIARFETVYAGLKNVDAVLRAMSRA